MTQLKCKEFTDGRWQSIRDWCFDILLSVFLLVVFVAAVCAILFVSGCAAGKTATGGVVVGFDVAALPENAGEVANAAATFLPQPWRGLAETAIYVLGGGGVVGAVGYAAKKKGEEVGWVDRDQHQAKIDATYDMGKLEGKPNA